MSSVTYVRRTATEYDDGDNSSAESSQPLSAFRSEQAYVLLGDPGAGKTTAFRHEAEHEGAFYATAREFIRGDCVPGPKDATVFIDGLDETRAGGGDPRTPLDKIVAQLRKLGHPRFRVSCRPVDWGLTDTSALRSILDGQRLRVLRLDPLGNDDIHDILNQLQEADGPDVDAADFVWQAEERGLGGLLDNPQSLQLLANVVATGTWPASRTDLFEEACRRLAEEQNLEHIDATGHSSAPMLGADDMLQAAGRLSVLFLLTNAQAICRHYAEKQKDDLALCDVKDASPEALSQALATKLFAVKAAGRFTPVHAHIAEYVGARYLSDVVEGRTSGWGVGLPSARVVALLVGHDGEVLFGLRGLAAWLAALCREARRALIDADPIGVLAYGDAGGFDDADLANLIHALAGKARQLLRQQWSVPALGSMIRPRTIEVLRTLVADDDRSDARQAVVDLLLRGVPHAAATPLAESGRPRTEARTFIKELLCLVRDPAWWPRVRQTGLEAALDTVERSGTGDDLVDELLQEIKEGQVHDPDNELRGGLLTTLYPHRIPPERVWDYVPVTANHNLIGLNFVFWFGRLEQNTQSADLPALLNGLSVTSSRSLAARSEREFDKLVIRLLVRALDAHGKETPVSQLSKWIELAVRSGPLYGRRRETPELKDLWSWFVAHQKICQECLLDFLKRNSQERDLNSVAWRFLHHVFQGTLPPGFTEWCRERANELAASHAPAARLLREWAVDLASSADSEAGNAASIQVQERVRQQGTAVLERRRREKQRYITHVRQHANDLATGLCRPELLDRLARTYFGVEIGHMSSDPVGALRDSLDSDERLVSAALSGFKRVLERDDLPDLDQIVQLDEAGRRSLFAFPVLAGLAEGDRTGEGGCRRLTDDGIRRAVGFYYISPHLPVRDSLDGWYYPAAVPAWHGGLVGSRPELVAESLVAVHASKIRRKINYATHLAVIARDTKHRELARLAVPSLLRTFPVRCTRPQLSALRYLLWASVRYMPDELVSWAGKKLARQSMDVAQRALWLGAGMMASPEQYLAEAMEFVREDSTARVRQLVEFVALDDMPPLAMEWNAEHLAMAVRGVGARVEPWGPVLNDNRKAHIMAPAEEATDKVHRLISAWLAKLAKDPGAEAANALNSLADEQQLAPWRHDILAARDQQADLCRAHLHRVPTADEVQRVLRDAEPANPGDLAALVVDRLKQLARNIRDGNTSDWRQYWDEGDRREPPMPKHEGFCRDALLSDLRNLLPIRIDAQPEGRYADDKRADIRVAYDGHAIPVEIKKNTHRRLWSAINDQLIAKYVRDPGSGGFGVYLVLWFGASRTKTLPPSGRLPKTPDELQERLENQLPRDKRRKIKVVVVDVSRPEN